MPCARRRARARREPMKIAIAGASGLVGGALVPELRDAGHDVVRLVRRAAQADDEASWDPAAGTVDLARLAGTEAIVNLAGENIGAGRWSAARRERILRSRVDATRTLIVAIAALTPKPAVLVNASAVGFYGDRGEERLGEGSAIGHGFLPEVCLAWETHAEGAARRGVRTARLRFGVVLAREGGALPRMARPFRLGLGGRLGDGRQWMSWVALDDAVRAIRAVVENDALDGPINVTAPAPIRNADFTAALARVLRRPAVLAVPRWALQAVVGRAMADEALLASTRAVPERLLAAGFSFRHPEAAGALAAIYGREL